MSQPTLYLFVGYPGSGKTTVASIIADATDAVHIWADRERKELFNQPSHSHAESLELYTKLNLQAEELLAAGKSVLYDTNFNFYKDREHMRQIAERQGAKVTLIWITTPKDLAARRAIHESHGKHTRLYGNMEEAIFNRIAGNLEAPRLEEHAFHVDGSRIDPETLLRDLKIR